MSGFFLLSFYRSSKAVTPFRPIRPFYTVYLIYTVHTLHILKF